ncbi:DNA-3-methyladenine glycosylase 2 family protein [Kangiella koreensis]|uniref:DNA-3-methyladenine glycosylase II n=1 Tax=Kangiella koreensis (strain DSM 16069 / JCM 12317 / KCTC 12182 / SW-125) TaxID=523791 RepID=C7R5W7_KANKD|nr:AlkA N-terminal domain-containing protein [Kangiella koreensis]ACV27291.1 transcriptional regulator, AraC family [Kangiella koreensis DSM 16069]
MLTTATIKTYQQARLARDPRFDGTFFVAVKTTGIYCRPICPAPAPKEENVSYYSSSVQAQEAGFRPCLRCRPETAPLSAAWLGNQAVLTKAVTRIQAGALNQTSLQDFSESMGITDRYLRKLFQQYLGVSPITYANHLRLMFAKQLLHQTQLPITDIAFIAGFNSVRRFNDSFKATMKLSPSNLRNKLNKQQALQESQAIQLKLHYRPPYDWSLMQDFLKQRELSAIETVTDNCYGRTFSIDSSKGHFSAEIDPSRSSFNVTIEMDDMSKLLTATHHIRRVLDLNSDLEVIENSLAQDVNIKPVLKSGLRLPATWDTFEAGVKAILGQQVSVKAAYTHTASVIEQLGSKYNDQYKLFPTAKQIVNGDLTFLKMPNSRKQTLHDFAQWYLSTSGEDLASILDIKGIGPWTYEYIKLRSGMDSDAFPEKDLGVIKAMEQYNLTNSEQWQPWRSYATLQLWHSL